MLGIALTLQFGGSRFPRGAVASRCGSANRKVALVLAIDCCCSRSDVSGASAKVLDYCCSKSAVSGASAKVLTVHYCCSRSAILGMSAVFLVYASLMYYRRHK